MNTDPKFPGIFIANANDLEATISEWNRAMVAWTFRAARGECPWICADCCVSFAEGMPDECEHGHDNCTRIIQRDKRDAEADKAERDYCAKQDHWDAIRKGEEPDPRDRFGEGMEDD